MDALGYATPGIPQNQRMSARQDPLEGISAEDMMNKTRGNRAVVSGRLEAELRKTADALRGSMDAAEFKHGRYLPSREPRLSLVMRARFRGGFSA
jgi:hypothetical protein